MTDHGPYVMFYMFTTLGRSRLGNSLHKVCQYHALVKWIKTECVQKIITT
uniref:Uncharacterized protein n=1 Tax=Arundo donax TaxID=35708 RepID=A0A0A9G7I2_ARUDO